MGESVYGNKPNYEWSAPVRRFYRDSNKAYVQNLDQNVLNLADVTHFAPFSNGTNATTTSSTTTSASQSGANGGKSNKGAIAGGVVGGLVALALITALIFYLLRRRWNQRRAYETPSKPVDVGAYGYFKSELPNDERKFAELGGPQAREMDGRDSRLEMKALRGQEVQGERVRAEMAE